MPVTPLADWRDVFAVRLFGELFRELLDRDAGRVARLEVCRDREVPLALRLVEALLPRAGVLPLRRADPDRRAAERVVWAMSTHLPQGLLHPLPWVIRCYPGGI
jgi:hypothetical protein